MLGLIKSGVGTAFMAQPSPIIIAELAYPTHRGKLTALFNTFYVSVASTHRVWPLINTRQFFGAISAAWLTYGTIKIDSDWSWRIPSLLQGAFPLVQLIFWFAIPQSPRWLISKGRVDEARSIFVHHHAGGYVGSPLVDFEIAEIQETLRLEQEHEAGSWKDMIKTPANRRRCLIAVVLGSSAQWVGNAVVTYYLVLVLNDIGITNPTNQALINGGLQIFNLLASIFCGALLVDRLGRRTLFLWSAVGMGISYVVSLISSPPLCQNVRTYNLTQVWTALNSQFIATKSAAVGTAVIPMLFIFFFHYDIAFTPLLYAYPTEIFPYALRGAGVSLTYFTSHVGLIAGQFVNPVAMAAISWKYYIVFCVTNALLVVFVWFFLPETKGYSLEEVAIAFVDEAAVRNAIPVFLKKDEMEASRIHIEEAA
jgi:MFS family permease